MNYEYIAELILFFIKHNRFIVYLINGNFLLQYTIYYISFPVLVLHLVLTIFQRPIASFFPKAGAKLLLFYDMTKFLGRFFELSS